VKILNLGCGTRTSQAATNIDWAIPVRLKASRYGDRVAPLLLHGERRAAYDAMRGEVLRHDLRQGIPFATGTVDAVYHSHVLEHIDREAVPGFLEEIRRVLRPGGVHRIVVPDLELAVRDYVASLDRVDAGTGETAAHDAYVAALVEQMVRREAAGSARQARPRRLLENALLGDARKRGETHQWMWDRVNLSAVLLEVGFRDPKVVDFDSSAVPFWGETLLDQGRDGSEYRPGSLYVEAFR
jgi:SAM-dependent methyltransferase